jgi:hypothetical protein
MSRDLDLYHKKETVRKQIKKKKKGHWKTIQTGV